MRNIITLSKNLTYDEFELTRQLWETMEREGVPPIRAAAMIYRHGRLDGRDEQRRRHARNEYHAKRLEQEAQTQNTAKADSGAVGAQSALDQPDVSQAETTDERSISHVNND